MRRFLHALAVLGLILAGVLALLGIAAWPPGGLMFALPYVFWSGAGVVGVASALLLVLTKPRPESARRG